MQTELFVLFVLMTVERLHIFRIFLIQNCKKYVQTFFFKLNTYFTSIVPPRLRLPVIYHTYYFPEPSFQPGSRGWVWFGVTHFSPVSTV